MRLQVRLTLWSILVMTAVVTLVSALDLIGEINNEFELALKRSLPLGFATLATQRAINRTPRQLATASLRDDPILSERFEEMMAEGQFIREIAVCDLNRTILNDSDRKHIGAKLESLDDFAQFVNHAPWWQKLQVLLQGEKQFEVTKDVANRQGKAEARIHIVVNPLLMRQGDASIMPILKGHLRVAGASIFGSMIVVLIFSATAFQPLGKLGEMLDLLAKGEYEMKPVNRKGTGEFGVVASKVQFLGQVLKGRQTQISELKSNVEQILNELDDAVLIFGRDRRLIAAAGTIEKFLRGPRADLTGRLFHEIFPVRTTVGRLLAQSNEIRRPIRNRRVPLEYEERGKLEVAVLSVEFLEGSGGGMVVRLKDPEATRQIGRHLQTAERLSAISRLTGGVAHEVKNPLNAMLMHVELAKMKLSQGDYDLQPQMDVISSEILRLDRVVKTFLDFTRPVELHASDTNLQNLVQEIADLARPQVMASGIELIVRQSDFPITVTVDPDLLKQAILNVVVNAIEAMSDAGKPERVLRIESGQRGEAADICVADTGPGIPAEVREKIYNLYFTTKANGSGIGLAMTFQIVQLHDGTMEVASTPGQGTAVTIRLPLAASAG